MYYVLCDMEVILKYVSKNFALCSSVCHIEYINNIERSWHYKTMQAIGLKQAKPPMYDLWQ